MLDRLQVAIDYAIENSPIDRINNSLKKVNRYTPQRIFGGYTECFN